MTVRPAITKQQAAHALWHYGEGGWEPGSFSKALCLAFATADPTNRRRLAGAFPGEGEAMFLAAECFGGIEILRLIFDGAPVEYRVAFYGDGLHALRIGSGADV